MQAKRMMRKARRGFTLIELMVVIVILGILGTAGVFIFAGAADDAEESRAISEISSMWQAVQAYKTKNRGWPEDGQAGLDALKGMTDSKFNESDPWNTPYEFRSIDGGYEIRSFGKDKNEGTDDDLFYNNIDGMVKPSGTGGGTQDR